MENVARRTAEFVHYIHSRLPGGRERASKYPHDIFNLAALYLFNVDSWPTATAKCDERARECTDHVIPEIVKFAAPCSKSDVTKEGVEECSIFYFNEPWIVDAD